jgi:hypothetical protein
MRQESGDGSIAPFFLRVQPVPFADRKLEKARADSGFLNADNFVDIEYIGIVAANSVQ